MAIIDGVSVTVMDLLLLAAKILSSMHHISSRNKTQPSHYSNLSTALEVSSVSGQIIDVLTLPRHPSEYATHPTNTHASTPGDTRHRFSESRGVARIGSKTAGQHCPHILYLTNLSGRLILDRRIIVPHRKRPVSRRGRSIRRRGRIAMLHQSDRRLSFPKGMPWMNGAALDLSTSSRLLSFYFCSVTVHTRVTPC